MTQAIFKRENVIVSESYCVDALTEPLIDFISINPRYKGNGPKHAGMRDLKIWQAHFATCGCHSLSASTDRNGNSGSIKTCRIL